MERNSYLFFADGFEEVEALTVVDVLRRADIPVKTVSITGSDCVTGAHGVVIKTDSLFGDVDFGDAEWLILPGGMPGASNLAGYAPLCDLLVAHNASRGKIAAICASPAVVLEPLGILDNKEATCYPSFEDHMGKARKVSKPVVVSQNLITGSGPAAAMQFALALVSAIHGEEQTYEIASGMLLYPSRQQFYF